VAEETQGNRDASPSSQSSKTSRRTFLKTGAGTLGGLVMAGSALQSLAETRSPDAPRPNFVIFIGEGVRADEYSATGQRS